MAFIHRILNRHIFTHIFAVLRWCVRVSDASIVGWNDNNFLQVVYTTRTIAVLNSVITYNINYKETVNTEQFNINLQNTTISSPFTVSVHTTLPVFFVGSIDLSNRLALFYQTHWSVPQ